MHNPAKVSMRSTAVLAGIMAIALTAGCDSEKNHRRYELMPDMWHTPAYKSQIAWVLPKDRVGGDGKEHQVPAMLSPVPGTVPREGVPYQIDNIADAHNLVNPLEPTHAVLVAGEAKFIAICATCHGRDGNAANGLIAKQFSAIPSLNGPNIAINRSDGDIFHIITMGNGRMPNFRAQLTAEQRWQVICYVRALDRATIAETDMEKMVNDAEADAKANPDDQNKQTALKAELSLLDQRKADLDGIQHCDQAQADTFIPPSPPRPEYETSPWPGHEDDASKKEGDK